MKVNGGGKASFSRVFTSVLVLSKVAETCFENRLKLCEKLQVVQTEHNRRIPDGARVA